MNAIKVLAQTADTVTISRTDLEALLRAAEDAEDIAAVDVHRDEIAAAGWLAMKNRSLTSGETRQLLEGVHPIRVWRDKRGLTQRALAKKAGVQPGYLSEIEARKKPGSINALMSLSNALEAPINDLVDDKAAQPRK